MGHIGVHDGTYWSSLCDILHTEMFFSCRVPAFEASKYLITNSEFLEFVKAGGYETQDFWSNDGWQWLQFRTAKHPTFWVCSEGMHCLSDAQCFEGNTCQGFLYYGLSFN